MTRDLYKSMIEVFDRNRNKVGILENAYSISEDIKINAVNYLDFTLPYGDPKNELCKPFGYVRYNSGDLYRIMSSQITINEAGDVRYSCEHVLALLLDNILSGEHVVGNRGVFTRDVIEYVLAHQLEQNWILDECDFSREFEYAWTHETLLNALFSIPNRFIDKYIWKFDTKDYPYRISLKLLDETVKPRMYIRPNKNMLNLIKTTRATNVCTRLYPWGEGEGINQLNIRDLTIGNKTYIESPQTYIDKYGIIERSWIDRRYTNAESLYEAALAMLNELQEPFEEYEVDLAMLENDPCDIPEIGKVVEIVGFKKTFITGITYHHDEIKKSKLSIANKPKDIAGSIADMADRQRIEMTYSQGATQFYQDHVYGNADANNPQVLKLPFPASMKIINAVNIDVEVGRFRKPFTVTGGGGAQTITQSNTSSSGSSSLSTTNSGGGQTSGISSVYMTQSASDVFNIQAYVSDTYVNSLGYSHNHWFGYSGTTSGHNHNMEHYHNTYAHTHGMEHWHNIAHTHTIPDHIHSLDPGISFGGNPSSFTLIINGQVVKTVVGLNLQENITSFLLGTDRSIPRDTYHKIEILPNDAAYVMLTVNVQGYIQSRGDMTV